MPPRRQRPSGDDSTESYIDPKAFFRAVTRPRRSAPEDVLSAAEALARSQVPSAKGKRVLTLRPPQVQEFWEAHAPAAWIDRRGTAAAPVPMYFLDRAGTPSAPGISRRSVAYAVPTSLRLAAQLANDPDGVTRAELAAGEALQRLRPWAGERAPTRVAWCLFDPTWGPTWDRMGLLMADAVNAPMHVLGGEAARSLLLDLPVYRQVQDAREAEMRRRRLSPERGNNGPGERVFHAAEDLLLLWILLRFEAETGVLVQPNDSSMPAHLIDRPASEVPDVLDPLLMIYGLGYVPLLAEGDYLILGAPWTRRHLLQDSWTDVYHTPPPVED